MKKQTNKTQKPSSERPNVSNNVTQPRRACGRGALYTINTSTHCHLHGNNNKNNNNTHHNSKNLGVLKSLPGINVSTYVFFAVFQHTNKPTIETIVIPCDKFARVYRPNLCNCFASVALQCRPYATKKQ
jgi:hypothetical protein